MDDGIPPNVVHEAEAQRQHPRVRVPGTVHVARGGSEVRYTLHDLSAGGLSFTVTDDAAFKVGDVCRARLAFTISPVAIVLPVTLQVRNVSADGKRVGVQFQNLGAREIAVLRQVIGGTLAGELVGTGDVITALSRDSFTKSRPVQPSNVGLSGKARTKAVSTTVAMLVVGVIAFFYAVGKLYAMAFVTRASAAKIAAPSFNVTMPRDGTFFSLVPADGVIKKGQPLGSFQAAMLDVVQSNLGDMHLSPDQLAALMGDQLKGTLTSPCNCKVQQTYAVDGQFANRGQALFELVPTDATPYVLARFRFNEIDDLPIGKTVAFTISGDGGTRYGKVEDVRLLSPAGDAGATDARGLTNQGAVADVIVKIKPDHPLAADLINRPVDVQLGGDAALSSRIAAIGDFFTKRDGQAGKA
ncbi:PilZ domain-containing protein [Solimonas marina]|uniref:HlyD family efflux transporter periplasmic adaptor subunit n=1 Tax=Solimonas marina TaxID=2714601 RepID=A0A969W8M6_9GAMM|nr:PilZ domain-containing protein [Solimonas marina]NKF22422.1 HlyD family efflux transporter periplasmic adaptor subunit [Solimonas marina]